MCPCAGWPQNKLLTPQTIGPQPLLQFEYSSCGDSGRNTVSRQYQFELGLKKVNASGCQAWKNIDATFNSGLDGSHENKTIIPERLHCSALIHIRQSCFGGR